MVVSTGSLWDGECQVNTPPLPPAPRTLAEGAAESVSARSGTSGPQGEVETRSICASVSWVAVKEFKISFHNSETILFTICPGYGNLNYVP